MYLHIVTQETVYCNGNNKYIIVLDQRCMAELLD